MAHLPKGWKEFYSHRASAPYFIGPGNVPQWTKPNVDENPIKKARLETDETSSETILKLQTELTQAQDRHDSEVAVLRSKVIELGVSGGVGAGHNAQHGHVLSLSSTGEPRLPPMPTLIEEHDPTKEQLSKWTRADLMVNDTLTEIFRTETCVDANGETVPFKDGVDPLEGKHLYNLVKENPGFLRTCEIGCAMGTSALYLCQALRDKGLNPSQGQACYHVACDPNQDTQYKSIARTNIKRAGLEEFFRLVHEPNYLGLPKLVREVREEGKGRFHLVFVDGWHTFDYTLLDLFFADLLCEVGGVICLDDINHKGVQKALKWVRTNLDHLKYVEKTPASSTMATFVKTGEDSREWSHFKIF